jgi:Zn-dependent peptidase ImmA (M78 family)/transcriptional regulator with XRE-family HTH domain
VDVVNAGGVGARVRELRKRAGLSSRDLAERIGLDPSALSNIETGQRAIKTGELTSIAAALNVSPLAILDESSLVAQIPVAPRSPGGARLDGDVYRELLSLTELHEVLTEANIRVLPDLGDVPDVSKLGWHAAADALADWTLGRVGEPERNRDRFLDLVRSIEVELRIDVLVESCSQDVLMGAAITDDDFPLIFVNGAQSRPRALFTLSHELGHVLARDGTPCVLDADLVADDDRERLANAFAAAVLMPERRVKEIHDKFGRTAKSLAAMIATFDVSYESLVYRLHNLRVINAAGRDALQTVGWAGLLNAIDDEEEALAALLTSRRKAPLPYHPPIWLCTRLWVGFKRGVVSVRPLARLLQVDPEDLLSRIEEGGDSLSTLPEFPAPDPDLSDEALFAGSPV